MPKLKGLFDSFYNLNEISVDSLIPWLKNPHNTVQLEDYLANKILYPTTVPVTEFGMKIDLAILREALRMNSPKSDDMGGSLLRNNPFLNITLRKIIIPERFLGYVPDLTSVAWAFVDGLLLNRRKGNWFEDIWTVVLVGNIDEIVGTVLLPQFGDTTDNLILTLPGKDYKIKAGSLALVPCPASKYQIAYKFTSGKILGKNLNVLEVYGGKLGLMIDGRTQ